jgi:hypothetical protein
MVVHVYFLQNWVRKSKFLAIVDLELPASGLRLFEQLWDSLKAIGDLTDQQIIDGLVIFSADGPSDLQGVRNGVQKRLCERVVKLQCMHCIVHRVQLIAKSAEQCMILGLLLALLRLAANLYSKLPLRIQQLHHAQEKMQAPHYKLRKQATTRWIGYADPMARLNEQCTSVVDHTATAQAQMGKNNNAETRLACQTVPSALTNLTTFLTMLATLPFMRMMTVLVSQLHSNTLYVGAFTRATESAGSHLT